MTPKRKQKLFDEIVTSRFLQHLIKNDTVKRATLLGEYHELAADAIEDAEILIAVIERHEKRKRANPD